MILEPAKGVAQPWGGVVTKTGGKGTGHGGQGASKPAPQGCPSVALRSYLGKEGRTWVESVAEGRFAERNVRCESGRAAQGPAGTLQCVSDDRATLAV